MRNREIDFIRGVAIVIMVAANAAPNLLESSDTNIYFRFIGSLAAPLFIFLSGVTFRINAEKNKKELLQNGFILILTAALVDVCIWGILPFSTFDVLYLIGISQVVYFFFHKLPAYLNGIIVTVGFLVFFLLKSMVEYRFEISDVNILELNQIDTHALLNLNVIRRLIFDGWFPMFPWMFFFGLGYLLRFDTLIQVMSKVWFFFFSSSLFVFGVFLIFHDQTIQDFRDGYIELFYPITLDFLLMVFGWLGVMIALSRVFINQLNIGRFLIYLGERSLFVYILHLVVISAVLSNFSKLSLGQFLLVFALFIFLIVLVLVILDTEKCRELRGSLPRLFRKIMGI
jgi:uncharacterized membrane protein